MTYIRDSSNDTSYKSHVTSPRLNTNRNKIKQTIVVEKQNQNKTNVQNDPAGFLFLNDKFQYEDKPLRLRESSDIKHQ